MLAINRTAYGINMGQAEHRHEHEYRLASAPDTFRHDFVVLYCPCGEVKFVEYPKDPRNAASTARGKEQ